MSMQNDTAVQLFQGLQIILDVNQMGTLLKENVSRNKIQKTLLLQLFTPSLIYKIISFSNDTKE